MAIPNIAVSTGSACTSASLEPSYVMRALGVPDDLAHTSIRFGLSRFTKEWEMEKAADLIIAQVKRLRDISPLWEMKQQGIDLSTIQWSSHSFVCCTLTTCIDSVNKHDKLNHSYICGSIIIGPMTSLAISQNSVVSLLLQGVRCNLQSIHSPIPTPKSLKVMQVVWGSRMLSVTRRSTSLQEMYGLGPNSRRRANKRAIDVGVRGSVLVLTMVFWNHCTRSAHDITSGPASSIVFPANAFGSMQYLRIAVATSPIHTGCFSALPPLMLISQG